MTRDQAETLVSSAQKARERAYAPYSNYHVGAALLGEDGEIYSGCNVENSSYGATICAERVAVFAAVAKGCRNFEALALATGGKEPAPPCGMCLQVLAEFAPSLPVLLSCPEGDPIETTLEILLPRQFNRDELS